jgi:hypothetical protein
MRPNEGSLCCGPKRNPYDSYSGCGYRDGNAASPHDPGTSACSCDDHHWHCETVPDVDAGIDGSADAGHDAGTDGGTDAGYPL